MAKIKEMEFGVQRAEHVKAEPYGWGRIAFLADRKTVGGDRLSMARVVLRSGGGNPMHVHPNCDELLYLLKGTLRHICGEHEVLLNPGDTLRVGQNVKHRAQVVGDEDAEMIVVYSAGERETVFLEEV